MLLYQKFHPNLPARFTKPSRRRRRPKPIYKKKAELRAGCVQDSPEVCIANCAGLSYHQVRPKYNCNSL